MGDTGGIKILIQDVNIWKRDSILTACMPLRENNTVTVHFVYTL
jgi:hypothetical protein